MTIELDKTKRDAAIASIKQYFQEHLEQEIGDLKASLLLDYALKELAPTFYNQGVADAQAQMAEWVSELDATCYEPEFGYWTKR